METARHARPAAGMRPCQSHRRRPVSPLRSYRLSGTYRHIIVVPQHVDYAVAQYDDHTLPLLEDDVDRLAKVRGAAHNWSLLSTLRQPSRFADSGVLQYSTAEERRAAAHEPLASAIVNNVPGGKYKALALQFSLPPASYATMVVREILKSPTDPEFQVRACLGLTWECGCGCLGMLMSLCCCSVPDRRLSTRIRRRMTRKRRAAAGRRTEPQPLQPLPLAVRQLKWQQSRQGQGLGGASGCEFRRDRRAEWACRVLQQQAVR